MKPNLTVEQVVAMAKQAGSLQVNPLRYRRWRGLQACEQAVRLGLLRRSRRKLDLLIFYPVEKQ